MAKFVVSRFFEMFGDWVDRRVSYICSKLKLLGCERCSRKPDEATPRLLASAMHVPGLLDCKVSAISLILEWDRH